MSMGAHLREALRADMIIFGFAFVGDGRAFLDDVTVEVVK